MVGTRQVIAYALIALGALWLLIEIGFVPPSLTQALLGWWPLLIVGVGLDFVLPADRRGPLPITAYAAAAILVIALFGISAPVRAVDSEFERPLPPDASTMTALLELGSASSTLAPAEPETAVEAEFDGQAPGKVELTGSTDLQFELRRGRPTFQFGRASWEIELNPNLRTLLDVRGGSGRARLDLAEFDLTQLILDAGSGRTELTLPGGGRFYSASVEGGSGRLELDVMEGASLDLGLRTRSGRTDLRIREGSDVQLELATGSGSVNVELPRDAPIRVEILDDGSGRVRMPNRLERRSGSGDTGVWQTASYQQGGRVINVRVVNAGSGSITFK